MEINREGITYPSITACINYRFGEGDSYGRWALVDMNHDRLDRLIESVEMLGDDITVLKKRIHELENPTPNMTSDEIRELRAKTGGLLGDMSIFAASSPAQQQFDAQTMYRNERGL